jgi:outer membrane immunogenic protein
LITPRLMVFATGGASWLRVQASALCGSPFVIGWCIGPPGPTNVGSTSTVSATVLGWTIGGGLEWMLTQNWLLRGEYRYADYQQFNYTLFPGNAAAGLGTDAILANKRHILRQCPAASPINFDAGRFFLDDLVRAGACFGSP